MKEVSIQENKRMVTSTEVLTRLKVLLGVRSAKELAQIFKLKPNTISSWKKRNTLCYAKVIEICNQHEIDLNELFCAQRQNIAVNKSYTQVPIIYIDDYLEYYLNLQRESKKVKQIYLPKRVNFDIVIQLYSNVFDQMQQAKLMYAFCKKVDASSLSVGNDYIFLIKNKGFQRHTVIAHDIQSNRLRISEEKEEMSWINTKEIAELFQCINYVLC